MSDQSGGENNRSGDVPPPAYTGYDGTPPSYQEHTVKKVDLPPYTGDGNTAFVGDDSEEVPSRNRHVTYGYAAMLLSNEELGTDSIFILCFLVCLLFNWVGYIICCCLFTSIAARCGALSGIGLNLIKMLVILRKCQFENPQLVQTQLYLQLHDFQYGAMMLLGIVTMFYGFLRYNTAKAQFNRQALLPRYM